MTSITTQLKVVAPPQRARLRLRLGLARAAVGVGIIAVWWIAAHFDWLSDQILPSPFDVLRSFVALAFTGSFWISFLQTLASAMGGLLIAFLIAVPVGLALGITPVLERMTRFLLDLGRSFPVIALLPVMILLLGTSAAMKVTVIVLGVVWPILLQTTYGSRRMDPVVRDTTKIYRITLRLRFFKVVLPAAAPFIATGVRVAASVAILLSIAVELLGRTPGMGHSLGQAQIDGRPDIALAYLVYSGLLGMLINWIFMRLEDRIIVWNALGDKD